jgi:methylated-DNA-[protein]-cysteine S-methyltransferase
MTAGPLHRLTLASPLGPLTVNARDGAIVAIDFADRQGRDTTPELAAAARQLADYFVGRCRDFALRLAPVGSAFERAVWDVMLRIPPGRTRTYGELAAALGAPGAARAVGAACGRNPIPIVIPCHRITAAGGHIGGYSGRGGVSTKRFLLALENGQTSLI